MTFHKKTYPSRPARRGLVRIGLFGLLTCLSISGWLAFQGFAALREPQTTDTPTARPASLTIDTSARTDASSYLSIEQIVVGHRVVTPRTDPGISEPTAVDPATWKRVSLRLNQTWDDGTSDPVEIESLQPPRWVAEHDPRPGSFVSVPPDLEELGLVKDPTAARFEVTAVGPCPAVATGSGRVVLATMTHLNANVFAVTVQDGSGHREELHPTGIHRFWSEDRNGWVRTDHLKPGVKLRGHDGPLSVVSAISCKGVYRVYNLTVEDDHVYYVARLALLTHNAGSSPSGPTPSKLTRYGKAPETVEKLAADAAAAEKNGFPHGVSTTSKSSAVNPKYNSTASGADIAKHFDVTKTGRDPCHYTVELPKPVTQAIADLFNRLFGRS